MLETYLLSGLSDYTSTWALQERLRERVLQGGGETLLLCQHPPVVTIGKRARGDALGLHERLATRGIEVLPTTRGGLVTYHGPGQLLVYPIRRLERGVLRHVLDLAQAAVEVAAAFGATASFDRRRVGVFAGGRKLAALGVHVRRRVSVHGLALNVRAEAAQVFGTGLFVPCGDACTEATSLEQETGRVFPMEEVARAMAEALARIWGLPMKEMITATKDSLLSLIGTLK